MMIIEAKYEKNWIIAEYMSETFTDRQEKSIPDNIPVEEVIYEKMRLQALCEDVVWRQLHARGFITIERYKEHKELLLKSVATAAEVVRKKTGKEVPRSFYS